jgi:putative Mg2+ transporter-C (MgtC) family protein
VRAGVSIDGIWDEVRALMTGICVAAGWYPAAKMIFETHYTFTNPEQMDLSLVAIKRLLMACAMGGVVGIEREYRHKDSGLRTNMLICVGSALFTLLSPVLAGTIGTNQGQVASNIVQGIGFLGAGLILHTRSRVLGLTSAATVWVVASVGMACGAGLYAVAGFATVILLASLQIVGAFEHKLGWKRFPMLYEVRADVGSALSKEIVGAARAEALADEREAARHRMYSAVLKVLDAAALRLHVLDRDNVAGLERVSFSVLATTKEHQQLLTQLRASDATDQVVVFRDLQEE